MKYVKILLATLILLALIATLAACSGAEAPVEASPEPIIELSYAFPFPFTAEDLRGNLVTEASLGEKDLFFVYYWTTWCPACVNGMPGLSELADEFGDRIGFLSLLGDFGTARDIAIDITDGANAPFITVDAGHPDFADLVQLVQARFLPTSIIIDVYGNIIGEHIVGSSADAFRAAIEDALSR